jgi:hypothetical protein
MESALKIILSEGSTICQALIQSTLDLARVFRTNKNE